VTSGELRRLLRDAAVVGPVAGLLPADDGGTGLLRLGVFRLAADPAVNAGAVAAPAQAVQLPFDLVGTPLPAALAAPVSAAAPSGLVLTVAVQLAGAPLHVVALAEIQGPAGAGVAVGVPGGFPLLEILDNGALSVKVIKCFFLCHR